MQYSSCYTKLTAFVNSSYTSSKTIPEKYSIHRQQKVLFFISIALLLWSEGDLV